MLLIAASILAARKLVQYDGGKRILASVFYAGGKIRPMTNGMDFVRVLMLTPTQDLLDPLQEKGRPVVRL